MSYDLYFFKRNDSNLTEQSVADYLNANLPFSTNETGRQWDYENPDTGVYFLINHDDPDEELESTFNSEVFTNLNYSVSINFFRPDYFGYEIFPIIEKMAADLDLYLADPQDENDAETPRKFPIGYLQEQWLRHNSKLSGEYFKEYSLVYMPVEKARYIWDVQFNRSNTEDALTEDIFVAGILVLKRLSDGELVTISVWPEHIPVILPVVDYVVIMKKYRRFFKSIEEEGLISYQHLMANLGDDFEDFNNIVAHLKVLKPAKAKNIKDRFNSLKIETGVKEFGSLVNLDGFVNSKDTN